MTKGVAISYMLKISRGHNEPLIHSMLSTLLDLDNSAPARVCASVIPNDISAARASGHDGPYQSLIRRIGGSYLWWCTLRSPAFRRLSRTISGGSLAVTALGIFFLLLWSFPIIDFAGYHVRLSLDCQSGQLLFYMFWLVYIHLLRYLGRLLSNFLMSIQTLGRQLSLIGASDFTIKQSFERRLLFALLGSSNVCVLQTT